MSKSWLVFWVKGGRLGAIENTAANLAEAHSLMSLSLIQEDITGTMHFNVMAVKKQKKNLSLGKSCR